MSLMQRLERGLRHQSDVLACLFTAVLPLPLFSVFWLMPWTRGLIPQGETVYNLSLLPFSQTVLALVMLVQAGVGLYAWQHRRSSDDMPRLVGVTLVAVFAGVILLSLGYGYRDSPLILMAIGMLLLVRALFKPRVYKAVFVALGTLFVLSEVMFWASIFPYAPLLQSPVFIGQPLTPWWSFWLRVIYVLTAIPLVTMFFVLARIMQREKQMLEERVRTDALTGLASRREFLSRCHEELHRNGRQPKPLCLLLIDLDHFKRINDTWGHAVGDRVLQKVGELLRTSLRRDLDVAARFGGEEFAVLLPQTALPQALAVAEQLSRQLEAIEFQAGGQLFQVTQSVGLVQMESGDLQSALRQADANLYAAKSAGRNRVVASRVDVAGNLRAGT